MPPRRLRLVAPILVLLVALGGVVGAGAVWGSGGDVTDPAQVASDGEHGRVPDAAAVVHSATDHLRTLAAPAGPLLAWVGAAASAAAALAVGAVALVPAAVPSGSTAHVRRRGPPSPV
jgi:hypothetical protein